MGSTHAVFVLMTTNTDGLPIVVNLLPNLAQLRSWGTITPYYSPTAAARAPPTAPVCSMHSACCGQAARPAAVVDGVLSAIG